MFSAIFAVLFGLSLLPGRKPLCLRFAERISGGIMPDGAEAYCRRLTWIWFAILMFNAMLSCCLVRIYGKRGAFWIGSLPYGIYYLHEKNVGDKYAHLDTNDNWFVLTVNDTGITSIRLSSALD